MAVRLLDKFGVAIEWDRQDASVTALERFGTPLPQTVLDSITRNGVALIRTDRCTDRSRIPERQRQGATQAQS